MRSSASGSGSLPSFSLRVMKRVLQMFAMCTILYIAVAMQAPSSFLQGTPSIFRLSKGTSLDKFEHMFATKTKYWDQRKAPEVLETVLALPVLAPINDQSPRRQEFELIQTQLVARHGIRYPTLGNIKKINGLLKRLKPYEDSLPHWMKNYTLPYNKSVAGELADAGKQELWKLGARNLARSNHENPVNYSKEKYHIRHTYVTRTRHSAIAFVESFFENPDDVEYIVYPKDEDLLLRFFDQCARYQRDVKKNQTAQQQLHEYQNSNDMTKIALWLKHSLGLKREGIEFSPKDLMAVQSACAFDIALYHLKHHWCSLMSMTFIHSLDYLDDLEQFYWIGGGYKLNYEMAAVLLRELFDSMKGKVNGSSSLVGNFFFAHAETTLPLMTLLGYGDRSPLLANFTQAEIKSRGFRSSKLSPFAANVEFRLFKSKTNDEDVYVQILVNEKESEIPDCGRVFCKLSELEKQWDYYLNTYDFTKNSTLSPNISTGEEANPVQGDKKPREDEIAHNLLANEEPSAVCEPHATDTPLSLPLGSFVELKLDYICAVSSEEVKYLKGFTDAGQVNMRGRLHLSGGISQRSIATAFINTDTKHCDHKTCFRLQTDKGVPVTLRFELSPDVATKSEEYGVQGFASIRFADEKTKLQEEEEE
ncbi:Histidine phosphatase superfamily (branch 2) [Phytophthora infestans]|uniref:Multiple inositol polyphosphate phosphatase 1 n=1 Tax=Phytophthora infestans TaxID=4787 RepID=A0A833WSV9_PHYIN|nr:Histidine phosphatase superfamily (branch 2) [Phytophthora infestans]